MGKTTYLLGAGFSAPLGIPVVSNFLEKSKDLYFKDPEQYGYFEKVFATIKELSASTLYYQSDFFNIEDILSLLSMHSVVTGNGSGEKLFMRYVADVVEAFTPPHSIEAEPAPSRWSARPLAREPWLDYCGFVASLLNHAFIRHGEEDKPGTVSYEPIDAEGEGTDQYAVVTLNYDMVLEAAAKMLNEKHGTSRDFRRAADPSVGFGGALAKLHGSVSSGVIVPPTWNKTLANSAIRAEWRLASRLLSEANHICVLGYSLPAADNYIKYLLRAAVVDSTHLKSIDVLCLDPEGLVEARYRAFVRFPHFRFRNFDVRGYLKLNVDRVSITSDEVRFDQLRKAHEYLFS